MPKPGDIVNVYEDPWTGTKVEGQAKLIELLGQGKDREYWLVEFIESGERHARWIKKHAEVTRPRGEPIREGPLAEATVHKSEIPTFATAFLLAVKKAWETKETQAYLEWLLEPYVIGVVARLRGVKIPHEFFPPEIIDLISIEGEISQARRDLIEVAYTRFLRPFTKEEVKKLTAFLTMIINGILPGDFQIGLSDIVTVIETEEQYRR